MSIPVRPGLLVSVRSAAEAEAALAGGADLIDVKEPTRGSLGRADDAVIEEVIRVVAGRRPVSAAMGEWMQKNWPGYPHLDVTYFKWGFANVNRSDFAFSSQVRDRRTKSETCSSLVPVAYADWHLINAPEPTALSAWARHHGTFLLDTYTKNGSTLLDWMPIRQIVLLTKQCHNNGVRVALAGSLGPKEIAVLAHLKPDWFAVRGAVCIGGREGMVDVEKVRALKTLIEA